MKTVFYLVLALIAAAIIAGLSGCVQTTVKDRWTDAKGHVVERETTTKATDPAAWRLGEAVVTAYSPPRPRIVREEKSGKVDPRDLPLTDEDIAGRFKSAPTTP